MKSRRRIGGKEIFLRFLLISAIIMLPSLRCQKSIPNSKGPGTDIKKGEFILYLTDIPLDNVEAVNITISRVDVVFTPSDNMVEQVITISKQPQTFDLLTLRNGVKTIIGIKAFPEGTISQIRLIITQAYIVVDGVEHDVFIPSGIQTGVKLVGEFEVTPERNTEVILDFDAEKSIINNKGKGYILKPVISIFEDTVLPVISLFLPEGSMSTQIPEFTLIGRITDDTGIASATLTVNTTQYPLSLAEDGIFTITVPLKTTDGPIVTNNLVVEAVDNGDNVATQSFIVYFVQQFVPHQVLVRFHPNATEEEVESLINDLGANVSDKLGIIKLYQLTLPINISVQEALDFYNNKPLLVAYAMPNYYATLTVIPSDPGFPNLWGMDNTGQTGGTVDADIDAPEAWDINIGNAQRIVAVLDSGVDYNHIDLNANMWFNIDELPGDANNDGCPGICGVDDDGDGLADFEDPQVIDIMTNGIDDDGDSSIDEINDFDGAALDDDENGYIDDFIGWDFRDHDNDPIPGVVLGDYHGTHVTGTIGGIGNNFIGVVGVNWQVTLMPLRVFSAGDDALDQIILMRAIKAFAYAANNGADVTNNSWRGIMVEPTAEEIQNFNTLMKDVNSLGVLHVMAAGNEYENLENLLIVNPGIIFPTFPGIKFPTLGKI